MNKVTFETLVDIRIKEAKILLDAQCYQGAYYLAGYAVECTLKACITKQVQAFDFPDKKLAQNCYTHDLAKLLTIAGLKQKLMKQEDLDGDFKLNWSIVKNWSEEARYHTMINKRESESLVKAITNRESGVLPWLQNYL